MARRRRSSGGDGGTGLVLQRVGHADAAVWVAFSSSRLIRILPEVTGVCSSQTANRYGKFRSGVAGRGPCRWGADWLGRDRLGQKCHIITVPGTWQTVGRSTAREGPVDEADAAHLDFDFALSSRDGASTWGAPSSVRRVTEVHGAVWKAFWADQIPALKDAYRSELSSSRETGATIASVPRSGTFAEPPLSLPTQWRHCIRGIGLTGCIENCTQAIVVGRRVVTNACRRVQAVGVLGKQGALRAVDYAATAAIGGGRGEVSLCHETRRRIVCWTLRRVRRVLRHDDWPGPSGGEGWNANRGAITDVVVTGSIAETNALSGSRPWRHNI